MTDRTHTYPPPWQDAPTLCRNLCISEGTLDAWVRQGALPAARMVVGKRMWEWAEVERRLRGEAGIVPLDSDVRRVFDAAKTAANR